MFYCQGGKEYGVFIFIFEIYSGQFADRCGGLYVGDVILVVNGVNLRDIKYKEVVIIFFQQVNFFYVIKVVIEVVFIF